MFRPLRFFKNLHFMISGRFRSRIQDLPNNIRRVLGNFIPIFSKKCKIDDLQNVEISQNIILKKDWGFFMNYLEYPGVSKDK